MIKPWTWLGWSGLVGIMAARSKTTVRLTKSFIKGLSAPDKRRRIHDETQVGLLLIMTPAGGCAFYFQRWWQGKLIERKIGNFGVWTVDQARVKAAEMQTAFNAGRDPVYADASKMTIAALFAEYRSDFEARVRNGERRQKSLDDVDSIWRNHVRPVFATTRVSALDSEIVQRFLRKKREASGSVHNKCLTLLRRLMNWGRAELKLDVRDWVDGAQKVAGRVRERFLSAEEMVVFFEAVADEDEIYRDIVMMWSELDLRRGLWRIPISKMKGKRPHVVPVIAESHEILARRQQQRDAGDRHVFPSPRSASGHVSEKSGEGSFWRRIVRRAGLWSDDKQRRLLVHDLRRTLASWQAMEGVSLLQIAKGLGQRDPSVTGKVYAHLQVDGARDGMETAVRAMKEAAGMPRVDTHRVFAETGLRSPDEQVSQSQARKEKPTIRRARRVQVDADAGVLIVANAAADLDRVLERLSEHYGVDFAALIKTRNSTMEEVLNA